MSDDRTRPDEPIVELPDGERLLDAGELGEEERSFDNALRPRSLEEFVGQGSVKEQLQLLIDGARTREEPVDHTLFSGPPGLGKTTLASIVAREMGVGFQPTSGSKATRLVHGVARGSSRRASHAVRADTTQKGATTAAAGTTSTRATMIAAPARRNRTLRRT